MSSVRFPLLLFSFSQECYPNTAAFAISAVKDGKVVLNKAYGKASREKNIDVTPNTRYELTFNGRLCIRDSIEMQGSDKERSFLSPKKYAHHLVSTYICSSYPFSPSSTFSTYVLLLIN